MTTIEKVRKAQRSSNVPPLGSLDKISSGFYSARILPWNGYANKELDRYSNPIDVLYTKRKINYLDDLPKGCYVYYIYNITKIFGQAITLATAYKLYEDSYLYRATGTVVSPIPIRSTYGYVCIMNESDFNIEESLEDMSITEAFEIVSKSINWDIANKEFIIKEYIGSLDKSKINSNQLDDESIDIKSESYIDAKLIKNLFHGGSIMCTGKDFHFVWVDENGICFDANGCIRDHDPLFIPVFDGMSTFIGGSMSDREYDYIIHKNNIAGVWPNC